MVDVTETTTTSWTNSRVWQSVPQEHYNHWIKKVRCGFMLLISEIIFRVHSIASVVIPQFTGISALHPLSAMS